MQVVMRFSSLFKGACGLLLAGFAAGAIVTGLPAAGELAQPPVSERSVVLQSTTGR